MKTKFTIICVLLLGAIHISAQQDSQYTHYMYNHRNINPAYMINEDNIIEVGGFHRTQWSGLPGGPKTSSLFVSIPLRNNLEVGANFTHDIIGSKIQIISDKFSADAAYKIRLTKKIDMSAGLKFGIDNIRLNAFDSNIADDPIFQNPTKKAMINLGVGVYFFNKDFYFGLSVPNFINGKLSDTKNNPIYQQVSHRYLTGGYIYNLNENVKLKPAFLVKQVNATPLSFDVSLNALIYNKLEVGIANRNQDAFSVLVSFYAKYNLKFGYSYDFGVNELSNFHSGSHEIFTIYRFDTLGLSKTYKSPRFY